MAVLHAMVQDYRYLECAGAPQWARHGPWSSVCAMDYEGVPPWHTPVGGRHGSALLVHLVNLAAGEPREESCLVWQGHRASEWAAPPWSPGRLAGGRRRRKVSKDSRGSDSARESSARRSICRFVKLLHLVRYQTREVRARPISQAHSAPRVAHLP